MSKLIKTFLSRKNIVKTQIPEKAIQRQNNVFEERKRTQGMHTVFKFPILFIILFLVSFNLFCYLTLRLLIFWSEKIFTPSNKRDLLNKSRKAKNYDEWKKYNSELDVLEKNEKWKKFPESSYFCPEIITAN